MRRREFIAAVGGAAVWPMAVRAQHAAVPVVGVLRTNTREADQFAALFQREMRRLGWEEGRNIRFEYRWGDGQNEKLPVHARDLVARNVNVIVALGNVGVAAAQSATQTTLIVGMTGDMVAMGLAASIAHPGGNTTGVSILGTELDAKRFELLHEFIPLARRVAVLVDPTAAHMRRAERLGEIERMARDYGIELVIVEVAAANEVGRALEAVRAAKVDGVNVLASPILNGVRALIIEQLREARLPAIYEWPETAEEGGLVGYGARISRCYRHVTVLVDKILRGANPADLPIEQPTLFTLAINAKTAEALGIAIPPALLLRVDEVIE
jgi:putative tryptophan/tyrosine transport system substrate-binding protein